MKNQDSLEKMFSTSNSARKQVIQYKELKSFFREVSVEKDSFFAVVALMKLYRGTRELGFYEVDYRILVDLLGNTPKDKILAEIELRVSLGGEEIESVMDKIYSPAMNVDFEELLLIFKLGKFKATSQIAKDLLFYLKLKGFSFTDKQKKIITKMVENKQFQGILEDNHKEKYFEIQQERLFKDISKENSVTNNFTIQPNPLDETVSRFDLTQRRTEEVKEEHSIDESVD